VGGFCFGSVILRLKEKRGGTLTILHGLKPTATFPHCSPVPQAQPLLPTLQRLWATVGCQKAASRGHPILNNSSVQPTNLYIVQKREEVDIFILILFFLD